MTSLERQYARLENAFQIAHSSKYANLVVPNGNNRAPVHRWFHMKEAYSCDFLEAVLEDTGLVFRKSVSIIDPFVGGGTTGVSAAMLAQRSILNEVHFRGIECNPFLHFVASTKFESLKSPNRSFFDLATKVVALVKNQQVDPSECPSLSTFSNPQYFPPQTLDGLLKLKSAIELVTSQCSSSLERDLLFLCLTASIEPVSNLRRDGRALRYTPKQDKRTPIGEFLAQAELILSDMPQTPANISGRVHLGDGRVASVLDSVVDQQQSDLIVFSPPYPNNIDYTEVYKLENWMAGFVSDNSEFVAQRRKTVHSHPSIRRDTLEYPSSDLIPPSAEHVIGELVSFVPDDRYRVQRRSMIRGYFLDMAVTLLSASKLLRLGGYLVFAVGNSAHGHGPSQFVIAADLIISEIARHHGFEIDRINVARSLRRRKTSSAFLRESVVFARRVA